MKVDELEAILRSLSTSAAQGDKVSGDIEGVVRLHLRAYRNECIGSGLRRRDVAQRLCTLGYVPAFTSERDIGRPQGEFQCPAVV